MKKVVVSILALAVSWSCGSPPPKPENADPNNTSNAATNADPNNTSNAATNNVNGQTECVDPAPGCGTCEAPACQDGVWSCLATPCPPPGDCNPISESTLAGVSIEFIGERCAWSLEEVAAGIEIPYVVHIAEEQDVMPTSQQNGCDEPGPSGLRPQETVTGGDQSYCICDVGLCPADPITVTLVPGDYEFAMSWDGVNWTGPSDFGNPKGDPFPAGFYAVQVRALGTVAGEGYEVLATLPIELVE